jgi:hypothetical protein
MYKPHKPYVPTAMEVMKEKNPKAQTKGAYQIEVQETIKDDGKHWF